MKEKENKKCGFGKVLLGIGFAAVAMVAYNKIPTVKNLVDAAINGTKNGLKKIGEKATEMAKKTEAAQAPSNSGN